MRGIYADTRVILLTCITRNVADAQVAKAARLVRRRVAGMLESAEDEGRCALIQEDATAAIPLHQVLQKHLEQSVSVIHLIGDWKDLDNEEKEGLSQFFIQNPQLQLLIWQGAAGYPLIKSLLLAGLPAIMALPGPADSDHTLEMTARWYHLLKEGRPAREIFASMKEDFSGNFNYYPSSYDFETDKLSWGMVKMAEDQYPMPGGLYALKEQDTFLSFSMPQVRSATQAAPVPKAQPKVPRQRRRTTWQVAAALGLLMMLAFGGAFITESQDPLARELEQWACAFPDSAHRATLRIASFPLTARGKCTGNDLTNAQLLAETLSGLYLPEDHQAHHFKHPLCASQSEVLSTLFNQCETDLVLWGAYQTGEGDSITLELNYAYTQIGQDSFLTASTYTRVDTATWNSGYLPQTIPVQSLLYEALGYTRFESNAYDQALIYFKQIPPASEPTYLPIALAMGNAYTYQEAYDMAEGYFSQAHKIDPENPEILKQRARVLAQQERWEEALTDYGYALHLTTDDMEAVYERGEIFLRLEMFEKAQAEMNRVLTHRPSHAGAHALLAVVHAHFDDQEDFFYHAEQAIQQGYPISSFHYYEDVSPLMEDERFNTLIAQLQQTETLQQLP